MQVGYFWLIIAFYLKRLCVNKRTGINTRYYPIELELMPDSMILLICYPFRRSFLIGFTILLCTLKTPPNPPHGYAQTGGHKIPVIPIYDFEDLLSTDCFLLLPI